MLKLARELPSKLVHLNCGSLTDFFVKVVHIIVFTHGVEGKFFLPFFVAEGHCVLGLVLVVINVVKEALLLTSCQWLNILIVFEIVVLCKDFHEVVVSLILWTINIVCVTDDTVANR